MNMSEIVMLQDEESNPLLTGGIVIGITTIMGGIAILQTYCEHRHINLLREASIAILIGMIIGTITLIGSMKSKSYTEAAKIFFFVLLPIIVFKEGYGLNKQHFMKNFFYVILYGIFATIFNFMILAALNYSISNSTIFWLPPNNEIAYQNSTYAEMFYSACITSKDSAVSLSVLEFEHAPKLHSIIFGEQILNDVIVFALSKTVQKFNSPGGPPTGQWFNTFIFIGYILEQLLVSLIVGIIMGSLATFITKESRFLSEHSSIVTTFTIYIAYLTFSLCEAFDFCGVLAVLICGIMLSHYQTYNLPKISATSSKITIKALAYASETFIYFYIGYMVTTTEIQNDNNNTDYQIFTYILLQFFVFSPISRILSMLLAHGFAIILRLKTKGPWRINKYEFLIMFYSGMIKGVVAYALICEQTNIGGQYYYRIISTTSLYMVVGSTIIIGGTLKYVCEWAYKQMDKENLNFTRHLSQESQVSIRQTFIQEQPQDYKKLNHKSEKAFKKIDENFIKPLLIYNYKQRKEDIIIAKKLEKKKNKYEKEQEMKMYDDSVKDQRQQFEKHKQRILADIQIDDDDELEDGQVQQLEFTETNGNSIKQNNGNTHSH